MSGDRESHWNKRYTGPVDTLSWFEDRPDLSVRLISEITGPGKAVIDIGGGASRLPDALSKLGYRDLTVLDLSAKALTVSQDRLGSQADRITWIAADITRWKPDRTYDLWHDRAVFHFLTDEADRRAYLSTMAQAVKPAGTAIIMSFAEDGPETCSGLTVHRYAPKALAETLARLVPDAFTPTGSGRFLHPTPTGGEQKFQYSLFRRNPMR